jgi:aryl-alcohol dehydrogenase-like predicted oxidoreductase
MSSSHARHIGPFQIDPIGLGCMNFNHAYGHYPSAAQATEVIAQCVDMGVEHFDTAALYGGGANESLVGPALKAYRNKIMLASKCGMTLESGKRVIDGRPATIAQTCNDALKRLQTDVIDLYYLHRWDKTIPVEESIGALSELVKAGKVKAIGLSEVSATTIKRAHAIHPIAAVQTEYSLWTREPEIGVLQTTKELGIALVAFSPVARGFFSAAPPQLEQLEPKDIRLSMPRFLGENYAHNLGLLEQFQALAKDWKCSAPQLALSWLLHQGEHVHVVPGTRSAQHMQENIGALRIALSSVQLAQLNSLINHQSVKGARYTVAAQADVDTEQF